MMNFPPVFEITSPKETIVKVNVNGLFGLVLIGVLIAVCQLKSWSISYTYIALAVVVYCGAMVYNSIEEIDPRVIVGSHLSFAFLIGGVYLNRESLWENICLFIGAIALGFAAAFMLISKKKT